MMQGGGHTFNFTATPFVPSDTAVLTPVVCAPALPGCSDAHLGGAALVHRFQSDTTKSYSFADLTDSGYRLRGIAGRDDIDEDGADDTIAIAFIPAPLALRLPLQAGLSWTNQYAIRTLVNGEPIFEQTADEAHNVQAWGTLVTAEGSFPALLVHERSTLSFFGDVSTTHTYRFITAGAVGAVIEVDQEGRFTDATITRTVPTGPAAAGPDDASNGLALGLPAPNPTAGAVRLPYTLAAPARVRIEAYDALGRRVAVVEDAYRAAGDHSATWSADGLPAGVYVLRLTAGATARTRTVTVTR